MENWLEGFAEPAILKRRVDAMRSIGLVAGSTAIVAVLSLPFLR